MNKDVPVRTAEISHNAKTGPVSVTMVSQDSCPRLCPLRGKGCYAEYGNMGWQTKQLNQSRRRSPEELAKLEAKAILQLSARRDLRLHVVGDARTNRAAQILAQAVEQYLDRAICCYNQGVKVWTYTHAWRTVKRESWGKIEILASCETIDQCLDANRRGYAAALIVDSYREKTTYLLGNSGLKLIPCPYRTQQRQCLECRLCMDTQRLLENGLVIGFEAHGSKRKGVAKKVIELQMVEDQQ